MSTYSYIFDAWYKYLSFLSNSDEEDEQIRALIEGSDVRDISSHIEAATPMHRKSEKIEYV
jgi:hypothetical protein